jgi:hypothetical protein
MVWRPADEYRYTSSYQMSRVTAWCEPPFDQEISNGDFISEMWRQHGLHTHGSLLAAQLQFSFRNGAFRVLATASMYAHYRFIKSSQRNIILTIILWVPQCRHMNRPSNLNRKYKKKNLHILYFIRISPTILVEDSTNNHIKSRIHMQLLVLV